MKEIDEILGRQIKKRKSPSVQYFVFDKSNLIYKFQEGFADVKLKIKAADQNTYHIYSITKTFTALAVLKLTEEKKIDIDESALSYLPSFPYGPDITVRQLLVHSAGVPNPLPLNWMHLQDEHLHFDSHLFFEKVLKQHQMPKFKPNEKFFYSNLAYVLLGEIIEKASGMQYQEYIRKYILKPLSLTSEQIDFDIPDGETHSNGYHKHFSLSYLLLSWLIDKRKFIQGKEGCWQKFKKSYVNGPSYGGLIATGPALMKYVQELLKTDSSIISEGLKQKLFHENVTSNYKNTGMCMSWFTGKLKGYRYFTHAGGGGGYYSELRIYPDLGIGSVLLFNRSGMRDQRFLDKVDKHILADKALTQKAAEIKLSDGLRKLTASAYE